MRWTQRQWCKRWSKNIGGGNSILPSRTMSSTIAGATISCMPSVRPTGHRSGAIRLKVIFPPARLFERHRLFRARTLCVCIECDHRSLHLGICTDPTLYNGSNHAIFSSSPAVVNGKVYIGEVFSGVVYGFDAVSGAGSSTRRVEECHPPHQLQWRRYVGSDDNNVYALDANTGALVWTYSTGGAVEDSQAIVNGVLYI